MHGNGAVAVTSILKAKFMEKHVSLLASSDLLRLTDREETKQLGKDWKERGWSRSPTPRFTPCGEGCAADMRRCYCGCNGSQWFILGENTWDKKWFDSRAGDCISNRMNCLKRVLKCKSSTLLYRKYYARTLTRLYQDKLERRKAATSLDRLIKIGILNNTWYLILHTSHIMVAYAMLDEIPETCMMKSLKCGFDSCG